MKVAETLEPVIRRPFISSCHREVQLRTSQHVLAAPFRVDKIKRAYVGIGGDRTTVRCSQNITVTGTAAQAVDVFVFGCESATEWETYRQCIDKGGNDRGSACDGHSALPLMRFLPHGVRVGGLTMKIVELLLKLVI